MQDHNGYRMPFRLVADPARWLYDLAGAVVHEAFAQILSSFVHAVTCICEHLPRLKGVI